MDSETQEIIDFLLDQKKDGAWPWGARIDLAAQELAARYTGDNNDTDRVLSILEKMENQGNRSAEYFSDEISGNGDATESSDFERWEIYLPVEIRLGNDLPEEASLKVGEKEFKFISVDYASGKLPFDPADRRQIMRGTGKPVENAATDAFITASGYAESWRKAWKSTEASFDALKGFIEYWHNLGVRRWGGDDPRAVIPHPKWYLVQGEQGDVELGSFIVSDNEVDSPVVLSEEDLDDIREASDFMRDQPSDKSTKSLIVDALRLYSQALDDRFRDGCFLGLWQVLEAVALSDRVNGKTSKIRSRVEWHDQYLELPGSGVKYILKSLAEKRNELVHRGVRNIEDSDLNVIKMISESALSWLIGVKSDLKTVGQLNTYYKYRTVGDSVISDVSEALEYVQDERD